jgi:hypothetical protein
MDQLQAKPVPCCELRTRSNSERTGIGVFQDYYQLTFLKDYTASDISWIGSLELFIMLAGVIICPCPSISPKDN